MVVWPNRDELGVGVLPCVPSTRQVPQSRRQPARSRSSSCCWLREARPTTVSFRSSMRSASCSVLISLKGDDAFRVSEGDSQRDESREQASLSHREVRRISFSIRSRSAAARSAARAAACSSASRWRESILVRSEAWRASSSA